MKNIEITNEYRGAKLGTSIKPEWKLTEIKVGHIDSASERAMRFNGVWVPNSLIAGLSWEEDANGVKTVTFITVPTWFAIKERL